MLSSPLCFSALQSLHYICHVIIHCKLATLSRRQKPMLPGRRLMSPAGRQSLKFYNEFCPRATLENIGFSSPLDKASLFASVRIFLLFSSVLQLVWDVMHFSGEVPSPSRCNCLQFCQLLNYNFRLCPPHCCWASPSENEYSSSQIYSP